jgi:hypothetical protein
MAEGKQRFFPRPKATNWTARTVERLKRFFLPPKATNWTARTVEMLSGNGT